MRLLIVRFILLQSCYMYVFGELVTRAFFVSCSQKLMKRGKGINKYDYYVQYDMYIIAKYQSY
jgi:hypothetical protein